jgi:hypothetical protein
LSDDPPPPGELVLGLELDEDNGGGAWCLGEWAQGTTSGGDVFFAWSSSMAEVRPTWWHPLPAPPAKPQGDLFNSEASE